MMSSCESLNPIISGRQVALVDKCNRLHSYFCGLIQSAGYVSRSSNDPRLVCIGADLTGVHQLLGRPDPGIAGYHIGGSGIHYDEALIKTIGELNERYAQLMTEHIVAEPFKFCSHKVLYDACEPVLSLEQLSFFTSEQLDNPKFLFKAYQENQNLGWYRLKNLVKENEYMWIPAQLLFIGYNLRRANQEPWICSSVTTGTATHSHPDNAKLSAILELIQLDCAMGHWYGNGVAPRIFFDNRLHALNNILEKYAKRLMPYLRFHLLPSPEHLSNFNVACVYQRDDSPTIKFCVGLGSDMSLEYAMYKAFLECYGVVAMLRCELLHFDLKKFDADNCYDLDTNVCYHGLGIQLDFVSHKFPVKSGVQANKIAPDYIGSVSSQLRHLMQEMTACGIDLYYTELPTPEADAVNFCNYRVWSPQLLPLSFPSSPWKNHDRYRAVYGGIRNDILHPYP